MVSPIVGETYVPGDPQPVVTLGSYLVNFTSLTIDKSQSTANGLEFGPGSLSNQLYSVKATFTTHIPTGPNDQRVQDFVIQDPKTGKVLIRGSYDYSWGNKAVNGFIIGDGQGQYYLISSAVPGSSSSTIPGEVLLNPWQTSYGYVYKWRQPWSVGNHFTLNLNGCYYTFRQDDCGTATDGSLGEPFTFNTCFLAGSLIKTPTGYKKVEELKQGDMVVTYNHKTDTMQSQPLTWVGRSHASVSTTLPMDMAGYPVCIKKDALADNIPSQDLFVTAEHCLFFDGFFVPARMMVNGQSIYFDTTICTPHDIFHIETEEHSVIIANNVMTESYLDTGNRHTFIPSSPATQHENVIVHPHATKKLSWHEHAAAPLCTTQEFVAPRYHNLLQRAADLNVPIQHPYKAEVLSEDPNFHLLTDQGRILREQHTSNGYKTFAIPPDTKYLTLISKTSRPVDVHGPYVDDRRSLGVLIGEILYFQGGHSRNIDAHLTTQTLDGWWALEDAPLRWTKGAAFLPLPAEPYFDGLKTGLLAIKVVAGGPYLEEDTPSLEPYRFNKAG